MDTLNASGGDRLAIAMQLLDWQRGFKVAYFMDRHLSAYLAVEQRLQLSVEREDCFLMYHMPCEQARKLDLRYELIIKHMQLITQALVINQTPLSCA